MRKQLKYLAPFAAVLLFGACSGEPEWQAAYDNCMASIEEQTGSATEGDSPEAAEMAAAMKEAAKQTCGVIRTTCEEQGDGPACDAAIAAFKKP